MTSLVAPVAGAKLRDRAVQLGADRVQITVLDWRKRGASQELDLQLRYRLSKAPDLLLDFSGHWEDPVQLDELAVSTYLHHAYRAPKLELRSASWNQEAIELHRLDARSYAFPDKAGSGELLLRATLTVPRGKWPLGCVRGRCAAVGGLALLPADRAGQGGGAWPLALNYHIDWQAETRPASLVIHDSRSAGGAKILSPALFWGLTRGAFRPARHFWHRGVEVRIDGAQAPLHGGLRHEGLWPWPRHQLDHLSRLAKEAIDTVLTAGFQPGFGQRLSVVVGPIRAQMVQSYSQLVVVSDRYLDTLPLKRFSKFHDVQVVRGMLDSLSLQHFSSKTQSPELLWLPGCVGASLVQEWRHRQDLRDEDMAQILAPLGFLPGVDDVLYSGQSTQSESFFHSVDDSMPIRRHPYYFANDMPSGMRLYHKLRALLGEEGFARWRAALIEDPSQDPRDLAERISRQELSAFFQQWLGPYPEVDYAVLGHDSVATKQGYQHKITLERYADRDVFEEVLVRVTDRGGAQVDLRWRPRGAGNLRETLQLQSKEKLASIEIDPEGRLQEVARIPTRSWESSAQGDPRFNNRWPAARRFVYTGVYFNLALAEMLRAQTRKARLRGFSGFLSWEAGRKRDLRRMFYFSLAKGRESWISGMAGMYLQLGRKVSGNRRRWQLRGDLKLDWLSDGGLDPQGGLRFRQRLAAVHDTRRFRRTPATGHRLRATLSRSDLWLQEGVGAFVHGSVWFGSLSYSHFFRLAHHHVLAAQAGVVMSFPQKLDQFRTLVRVGGIGGLTAFSADELFARGVATLKLEYRHVFLDSLRNNILGLAWLRDFGGVLFSGVSSLSSCEGFRGWGSRDSYVAQVGYGLTVRYDLLGIAPQLLRLDVAAPINRGARTCLGQRFPELLAKRQGLDPARGKELLAPISVNLNFAHEF